MRRSTEMNFWERLYLVEVARGLSVTTGKLVRNILLHLVDSLGIKRGASSLVTIQYPNQRRTYSHRYRGRHRLTLYEDGSVRCTACFLCATACPARCIHIESAEHPDPKIEKFPLRYEIDTLLCVYCGYCVEACPVDAIRMDTGIHPEIYSPVPGDFIEDKETLMQRSRDLEKSGSHALFEEHMRKMQRIEADPFADTSVKIHAVSEDD